jgi:hypothetical protein
VEKKAFDEQWENEERAGIQVAVKKGDGRQKTERQRDRQGAVN